MKRIKLLLTISSLSFCLLSIGQTKENPWSIGFYGVKTEYLGDLRLYSTEWSTSNYLNTKQNTIFNFNSLYGGGALSLDRYLNPYLDLGIYSSFSTIGFEDGDNVDRVQRSFKANVSNTNLHIRCKFLGQDDARFVPYLTLSGGLLAYFNDKGIGVNNVNDTTGTAKKYADNPALGLIISGGLGLEYKINKHISLRYQADIGWTSYDDIDFYTRTDSNDWQLQHSLGVTYSFGGKKNE